MAQVFRKSAVERLSSPEQLDKAMVVTSPMSWAVLAGVALIVAAAVAWAFLGRLPVTVGVTGTVAGTEGADCVISDSTGIVCEFTVNAGDRVERGGRVAVLVTSTGEKRDILSDRSGTVSMLLFQPGDLVNSGSELLRITPDNAGEKAVVFYVPAAGAREIKPEMEAVVTISGSKERRITGEVVSVSSGAVSVTNMDMVLGCDNGMSGAFASQGPVYSVICSFPEDELPETGMIVSGKIVLEQSAPINRLLSGLNGAAEG